MNLMYVCRTGNITHRCQYVGVENVLGLVWFFGTVASTIHAQTHCPPSHHHLSGGSGGKLHQHEGVVSMCFSFNQYFRAIVLPIMTLRLKVHPKQCSTVSRILAFQGSITHSSYRNVSNLVMYRSIALIVMCMHVVLIVVQYQIVMLIAAVSHHLIHLEFQSCMYIAIPVNICAS